MATVLMRGEKTRAIRAYLKAHPQAENKEVVEALAADGIEIRTQSVSTERTRMAKKKKARKGGRPARSAKASANGQGGRENSKANAVREMFEKMGTGKRTRNRDVRNALAEIGVNVSPAQIATIRKKMRRRRPAAETPETTAAPSTPSDAISLDHLVAAKSLVEQLGGIEAARKAVNAFARLNF
jgi:hypothetical protein